MGSRISCPPGILWGVAIPAILAHQCFTSAVADPSSSSGGSSGSGSWRQSRRTYDAEQRIESARLYGDVGNYQYYFLDLLVGTPLPQRASVIADTGSTICAFTCSGCTSCGNHLDAAFDFGRSQTAKWVPCGGDNGCSGCDNGRCSYSQSYTEGSSLSGSWFEDFVSLGDEFQKNPPVMARMGCHKRETKLFYTQKANGIIGLAAGNTKRPGILQHLFQDKSHVNTAVFSMCLTESGGLMTVGGYNASLHQNATKGVQWLPMGIDSLFSVTLSEISVEGGGGDSLVGGFGRTIVDSGTTFSYFPHGHYKRLLAAVAGFCQSHNSCGGAKPTGRNCWRVGAGGLAQFPPIKFKLGDSTVGHWQPKAYMYNRDGGDLWCYGFDDNGGVRETVLGATWMLHREVIFDSEKKQLGIADANCPRFRVRPPDPSGRVADLPLGSYTPASALIRSAVLGAANTPLLFTLAVAISVSCGLLLVIKNLFIARQLAGKGPGAQSSPSSARGALRARKFGRITTEEEVVGLASAAAQEEEPTAGERSAADSFQHRRQQPLEDELDDEVPATTDRRSAVPLETWLRAGAGSDRSAGSVTPASGSDAASDAEGP